MSQTFYISKIVKEQRNRKGISQKEIADRASVSPSTIERLETGKHTNLNWGK